MKKLPVLATAIAAIFCTTTVYAADEITVYSYRTPDLIAPVIEAFEAETNIKVNILNAKGLVERIKTEGKNSPADVLLTVDVGRLDAAYQAGITKPYSSQIVEDNVPTKYRHPDGNWIGVTLRGRVVFASNERVKQNSISYADLAAPELKGKVCMRDGQHVYSIALFASQLANEGEDTMKSWLKGVKSNLAFKPEGNDRAQAKAVFEGRCDYAVMNTYYVGIMKSNDAKPEQKQWAAAGKVIFPDQDGRGAHVNVAGVALIKTAPNPELAKAFVDFLASPKGQAIYAQRVHEFPVSNAVEPSELVKSFTPENVKFDKISLQEIADNRKRASEIVDEIGFNN